MLAGAAVLGLLTGCTPMTDIVATSSEETGPYDVRVATVSDGALTADVCIQNPLHSDEVANRLVRQLVYQGYRSITLNLASRSGPIGRFVWSGTGERREPGGPAANPCTSAPTR
jgi:hypothetical protein